MMTQTFALLVDAYRELHAKKMFWIVLILNVLVMGGFAAISTDSKILKVLWFNPMASPLLAYKLAFSNVVVEYWLTWVAALLALISTAGIFPDFLTSGAIDLYLAKPIGRLRLFITKYLAGLLFVALQVTIFAVLSFVVLGWRGGLWEPGLFWSIPLVVLFFSYLYAICVLLGVVTRSAIAALLLTLLAWFFIFAIDRAELLTRNYIQASAMALPVLDVGITALDDSINAARNANPDNVQMMTKQREDLIRLRDQATVSPELIQAHDILLAVKGFVPKTRETTGLLDRFLFQDQELRDASRQNEPAAAAVIAPPPAARSGGMGGPRGRGMGRTDSIASMQLDRQRPVWWIIGTSLLFEAAVLALAVWSFCRRDF